MPRFIVSLSFLDTAASQALIVMETEWKISVKIHISLSKIEPRLFIGNENVVWYYHRLKGNGITAVVSILRDQDGE